MITIEDVKAYFDKLGVPAGTVLALFVAFQTGTIPSITSRTYDQLVLNAAAITEDVKNGQAQDVSLRTIAEQHTKQMAVLVISLKQICLNTAKTKESTNECSAMTKDLEPAYTWQK